MKPTEYEFTLPDGSKRFEIVTETKEVFIFQGMHGATSARPVVKTGYFPKPDWFRREQELIHARRQSGEITEAEADERYDSLDSDLYWRRVNDRDC